MTVTNKEQAWNEANKLFPANYEKDYRSSERAGYDIYRHPTLNSYSRICDLGDRLKVYTGEYGENVTSIWIKPETIKNMGTNFDEIDYKKLCGDRGDYELTEEEAKLKINTEFGFEASRVKIITEVETFCKDGNYAKSYMKYTRTAQYCSTDYNYIRFDVNSWQYEMVNGALKFYYN